MGRYTRNILQWNENDIKSILMTNGDYNDHRVIKKISTHDFSGLFNTVFLLNPLISKNKGINKNHLFKIIFFSDARIGKSG